MMRVRPWRASFALLVAVVTIASGSTAAYATPDLLVGGGKAIVRIDAPKIDVEKVSQGQYRITLPASAKGQWLGTRKKTLMIGELSALNLVNGWSALGYKKDSKVAAAIKWKPAGAKVQLIPAQVTQAKKLADGRTVFDVTSEFLLPSQLTNASLNLARSSGATPRSYPKNFTYSFTNDLVMRSQVQGDMGAAVETLQSTQAGTCWTKTLNDFASLDSVSCNGTSFSGTLELYPSSSSQTGYVMFNGRLGVNGKNMSFSVSVAKWSSDTNPCPEPCYGHIDNNNKDFT
jgi:hypothetical protein